MKIPLNWLKEYVALPVRLNDLIQRLTISGLEVASIRSFGLSIPEDVKVKQEEIGPIWQPEQVKTAQVRSITKHPNADKLKLVELDLGESTTRTVVTGAPNIAVGESGMKVIVGLRGTTYFYEVEDKVTKQLKKQFFVLEPKELRGIMNDAMVMSSFELGINDEHEGIILLESDAPVGMPVAEFMGDYVLEVDVLPNMARCLSMLGIAREVAAITGNSLHIQKPSPKRIDASCTQQFSVKIENAKLCGRYVGMLVQEVIQGAAPGWMQRRLEYAGMRPINNIVDITNYVMLEYGQPLHAFDFGVLKARANGAAPVIHVRNAITGEKLVTLDKNTRELTSEDLVIADAVGPIALAGVMGGLETEVTANTKTILLESANFDAVAVRKTSRRFNLFSEASTRFSRGIHTEVAIPAILRAAELLQTNANGKILQGEVDNYPAPTPPQVIELKASEIQRLLGISIPNEEVERILKALSFDLQPNANGWSVTTPPFRTDLQVGQADLIEEIGRIYGYDRIPSTPLTGAKPEYLHQPALVLEEQLRDLLVRAGLQEVINYSLTSIEVEKQFGIESEYVRIVNAVSPERSVMRSSLLPQLFTVALLNREQLPGQAIFELGAIYQSQGDSNLPQEPQKLGLLFQGKRNSTTWQDGTNPQVSPVDFFDMKGLIEQILHSLHIPQAGFISTKEVTYLHPGRAALIDVNGTKLGHFGEIHPRILLQQRLEGEAIVLAELDLFALLSQIPTRTSYRPSSNFPSGKRDIALIVKEEIEHAKIEAEMRAGAGEIVRSIELFDVYRGNPVPEGSKSLAYAITYQAQDRTLTDKEIDQAHKKIEGRLRHMLQASIRGKD